MPTPFVDLFAGIGGMRIAFESHGCKCVATSERDVYAQTTYFMNFPQECGHKFFGDITKINPADIPDHNILLAGFPCQPFSSAGLKMGFEDSAKGALFLDVARIIAHKRPEMFLLENVKGLLSNNSGKTFSTILKILREDLGYCVNYLIIDALHFLPQHRERVFIIGFREETEFLRDFIILPKKCHTLSEILHPQNGSEKPDGEFTFGPLAKVHSKYTISGHILSSLRKHRRKSWELGKGFGFATLKAGGYSPTLLASSSSMGIFFEDGKLPRRLTPREWARLQGFPDSFLIPVTDSQAYKQFGNSVAIPVVSEVARAMMLAIKRRKFNDKNVAAAQ